MMNDTNKMILKILGGAVAITVCSVGAMICNNTSKEAQKEIIDLLKQGIKRMKNKN